MTRRDGSYTRATANPVLVGAATVLVTVVAVFLSYNANSGLPFVPTYEVKAYVPDAAGLVGGNEVRVGGKRVGVVTAIRGVEARDGRPLAELDLKLDMRVKPIRDDSLITVRPRSPLGLKYLELQRGRRGKQIPDHGKLPAAAAQPIVELDQVVNALDSGTRDSLQGVLEELGNGFAGRGAAFNSATAQAPELLTSTRRVAALLADRRTGLRRLIRGADATVTALAPVAPELGQLVASSALTADALARSAPELGQAIAETPATERAGISSLRVARPLLEDSAALVSDLRAAASILPTASTRLDRALDAGTPTLAHATALAERLGLSLEQVRRLSEDPSTLRTFERLLATLESAGPTLRFLAPFQLRCNYLGLWTHNVPNTISEGDSAGTWFRTLVVAGADEASASAKPAPKLHVNPYPNTAAPGQDGECEAGNEPYRDGQQIGNPPGNQGRATEDTKP